MLWLALHFPRLPLEVFAASNTDAQQALVVLENNRVYQRNTAAQACGIEQGTTLATAHSIQPNLKHQQRKPEHEVQRLQYLANALYRFSSYISLQAPDCVLLEIGGSLKLFGDHLRLADAAVRLTEQLGHTAIGRVARTPWAAIALARAQEQQLENVPLAYAGLPEAGIAETVIERFANMGIYTLGPLLNLPNKALGKRFGKPLLRYIAQLTGASPDPRQALHPAETFRESLHLLKPIDNKDDLHDHAASPMPKLALDLQHWLVGRQLGCEALQWQFKSHHGEQVDLPVRFAKGKQTAADVMRISTLKLEQIELPAEVLSISLRSKRLHAWVGTSQDLFGPSVQPTGTPRSADMGGLVDELHARLGDNTCKSLQLQNQHSPEHAWQYASAYTNNAFKGNDFLASLSKRPMWLFDPPRQVARTELTLLQGPERIQSQWWQHPSTHRDYYIAQHKQGAECWAFLDHTALPTNNWYLHGYFG